MKDSSAEDIAKEPKVVTGSTDDLQDIGRTTETGRTELDVDEGPEDKKGRGDEQRSVPTVPQAGDAQERTIADVPDETSGKRDVQNTVIRRSPPDGLSEEGDDDRDDHLEVGEGENEELEPVLALIRGSKEDLAPQSRPATKRKWKKPKKGISISEFLPKDQLQQEGVDLLDSDDELPRDTTVDDVLLEIGSALPSQDVTEADATPGGNILEDILGAGKQLDTNGSGDGIVGLPQRTHVHGHPSDSALPVSAAPPVHDGTSSHLPRRHEQGHVSDSTLKVGGDQVDKSGEGGDGIPLPGVPQRQHKHGHVTDASLQSFGSVPEDEADKSGKLVGVPHLSHQHGRVTDASLQSFVGLPQRTHIHGHPSVSALPVSAAPPVDDGTSSHLPRRHEQGHVSDSTLKVGGDQVDKSVEGGDGIRLPGVPQRQHKHGHVTDASLQSFGSVPGDEADKSGRLVGVPHLSHQHGYVTDASLQSFGSVPEDEADKPSKLVGVPHLPHQHGHVSESSMDKEGKSLKDGHTTGIPQRPHEHGHPSQSSMDGLLATDHEHKEDKPRVKGVQGHVSDSSLGASNDDKGADAEVDRPLGLSHRPHTHGHASDSTMTDIMSETLPKQGFPAERLEESKSMEMVSDSGFDTHQVDAAGLAVSLSSSDGFRIPELPHRPNLAPQRPTSGGKDELRGVPQRAHLHGHATDSSLGDVMYPKASDAATKEGGRPVISRVKHAHPSDSTVQQYLYPVKKKCVEDQDEGGKFSLSNLCMCRAKSMSMCRTTTTNLKIIKLTTSSILNQLKG